MLTVFLSSTTKDLAQAREAAFRAVQGLHGYHCVRMEDFGPWNEVPDDFCRARVAECDLFICLVGPLYGSRTPAGSSFTEREFDAAIASEKPYLVFLTTEDYPLPANLIEKDEDRQSQALFRAKAAKGRMVTPFTTPDQVSFKVVQGIRNWETSRPAGNVPSQATLLASQIKSVSYRVAVLNQSTRVSDDEIKTAVVALQTQIHRDFAPVWGIDAELTVIEKDAKPEEGSWWLLIQDESEYPGAIAYHSLTAEGLPLVKVSVANAQQYGMMWTTAASHDLMEMLANPRANLTVYDSEDGIKGRLYVREICDPVASIFYRIDGTLVSDFVYPSWFESFRARGSAQFDHEGKLSAAFEVAPGSYVTSCEVKDSSGWRQRFMQPTPDPPEKRRPKAIKTKAKPKR
jgi:hypothetical protein